MKEVFLCGSIGFATALLIIYLVGGNETGKATNYFKKKIENGKVDDEDNKIDKSHLPKVKEQLERSKRARKFFGVSNDNIDRDIQESENVTNTLKENAMEPEEDEPPVSSVEEVLVPMLLVIMYTVVTATALYLGNMATDGKLLGMLIGLFPKEAKALKLI